MRLENCLLDKDPWEGQGFSLPSYDREQMRKMTQDRPQWVHFGSGNLFRAFFAPISERLLESGIEDRGVIVVGRESSGDIDAVYRPVKDFYINVRLKSDGSMSKEVVGSVAESLCVGTVASPDWQRLKDIVAAPSLQFLSYTITEKGYGDLREFGVMHLTALLCFHRFVCGGAPVALVSLDNCSRNGQRLFEGVMGAAELWLREEAEFEGFVKYMSDAGRVSFPWSMVDKITPRPDGEIAAALEAAGVEGVRPAVTATGTFTAPFVNAEELEYWVLEDAFPNGRPALERAGVFCTSREVVEKAERMKVCTCLNPLHTTLAIFGMLLGHRSISVAIEDEDLVQLVRRVGYVEGLPVVTDPGILSPRDFLDQVIGERFPNPFIPDTPNRIACDTSQKIPIRFGETLKMYVRERSGDLASLLGIPMVLAGWCRYLLGVDDSGEPMDLSPDPRLEELKGHFVGVELGDERDYRAVLAPILTDETIFGLDLFSVGLADKVVEIFEKMMVGRGAVREVLLGFGKNGVNH